MGWAARARDLSTPLDTFHYRVRRWTAFEPTADDEESRSDRERNLERFAATVARRMTDMYPRAEPTVAAVRVGGVPQLLFEMMVEACDEEDARRRCTYRFDRALAAKHPGRDRRIQLAPPWGRSEVQQIGS